MKDKEIIYQRIRRRRTASSERKARKRKRYKRTKKVRASGIRSKSRPSLCVLLAPATFCLESNHLEVLKFYDRIEEQVQRRRPVVVDLNRIQSASHSAIAYLLSLIEAARSNGVSLRAKTISKKNGTVRALFESAGFFRYLEDNQSQAAVVGSRFTIQGDQRVNPEIAKSLNLFVKAVLPDIEAEKLKKLYVVAIECMANTKNHAYSDPLGRHNKWWLMATFDATRKVVSISFLDIGSGIPATMKKRFGEKVKETVGSLAQFTMDSEFIEEALSGKTHRSRTGRLERGKGLPRIRQHAEDRLIGSLIVASLHGRFNVTDSKREEFDAKLQGTLLSWEVTA